jgi:hypothetical protein
VWERIIQKILAKKKVTMIFHAIQETVMMVLQNSDTILEISQKETNK